MPSPFFIPASKEIALDSQQVMLRCNGRTITLTPTPPNKLKIIDSQGQELELDSTDQKKELKIIAGNTITLECKGGKYFLNNVRGSIELIGSTQSTAVKSVLSSNLGGDVNSLLRVLQLEETETVVGSDKSSGSWPTTSSEGYKLACKLYLEVYGKGLTKQERSELTRAIEQLQQLEDDANFQSQISKLCYEAREWQSYAYYLDPENMRADYPYSDKLKESTNRVMEILGGGSPAYLNYGFYGSYNQSQNKWEQGHHEVLKILPTGGNTYRVIIYNAGFESDYTDTSRGLVEAKKEYKVDFSDSGKLEEFIKLIHERRLRGVSGLTQEAVKKIDQKLEKILGNPTRVNQEKAQIRGNCSTRSNREAISEILSTELFRKVYNFVADKDRIAKLAQAKEENYGSPDYNIQRLIEMGRNVDIIATIRSLNLEAQNIIRARYVLPQGNNGSLVQYAIGQGSSALLGECIEKGVRGFELEPSGYSPFHQAIIEGKKNLLDLMLPIGTKADLEKLSADGVSPFMMALEGGRIDILQRLVGDCDVDLSPAKHNNHLVLNRLIEYGYSTNDDQVIRECLNFAQYLISDHKVDPTLRDGVGKNALDLIKERAARKGQYTPEEATLYHMINPLVEAAKEKNEEKKPDVHKEKKPEVRKEKKTEVRKEKKPEKSGSIFSMRNLALLGVAGVAAGYFLPAVPALATYAATTTLAGGTAIAAAGIGAGVKKIVSYCMGSKKMPNVAISPQPLTAAKDGVRRLEAADVAPLPKTKSPKSADVAPLPKTKSPKSAEVKKEEPITEKSQIVSEVGGKLGKGKSGGVSR